MKYKLLLSVLIVAFCSTTAWADEKREDRHDRELHEVKVSKKINAQGIAENKAAIASIQLTPGPQGPAGAAGAQGPEGPAGPAGDKGLPGDQGSAGDKGLTGDQGPAGDKGLTGDQGLAGDKGLPGDQGPAGDKGLTGDQGPAGDKGLTGDQGPVGDKGDPAVTAAMQGQLDTNTTNITNLQTNVTELQTSSIPTATTGSQMVIFKYRETVDTIWWRMLQPNKAPHYEYISGNYERTFIILTVPWNTFFATEPSPYELENAPIMCTGHVFGLAEPGKWAQHVTNLFLPNQIQVRIYLANLVARNPAYTDPVLVGTEGVYIKCIGPQP